MGDYAFDVTGDHPDTCCRIIGTNDETCQSPAEFWPIKAIGLCDAHAVDWMRENAIMRGDYQEPQR